MLLVLEAVTSGGGYINMCVFCQLAERSLYDVIRRRRFEEEIIITAQNKYVCTRLFAFFDVLD